MNEREGYGYTLDIKVLENEYFVHMKNYENGEMREFTEKSLVRFAQRIATCLYYFDFLEFGCSNMEARFTRERIRTYIKYRRREEYFYASENWGKPVAIGVFITYEDGKDVPDSEQLTATKDDPNAPKCFVW